MIINLTPHIVNVGGVSFPPSGQVARVKEIITPAPSVDGCPVVQKKYGEVENLPPAQTGQFYLVSVLVLAALGGSRVDCLTPDTGPDSVIRDKDGKIIGVRRLQQ